VNPSTEKERKKKVKSFLGIGRGFASLKIIPSVGTIGKKKWVILQKFGLYDDNITVMGG
jgi:hypothetical protein